LGGRGRRRGSTYGRRPAAQMVAAAAADSGGAASATLGGGERVGELRHGERKLAAGSTRAERRRRWGLRGEPKLRGSNGGGHGRGSGRARLGLLGPEREGGEGCRERVLREPKGKERSDIAVKMEKGRTARRVVAVALRAAFLGVRAGKRCRVARSRSVGEESGMGRRVWPGRVAHGRRCRRRHDASTALEEKNRGWRGME